MSNGIVILLCSKFVVEAPVTGCKCTVCKQARQIHRYHRSVVVAEPNAQVLNNIRRDTFNRRREVKRVEEKRHAAEPFNAIRFAK